MHIVYFRNVCSLGNGWQFMCMIELLFMHLIKTHHAHNHVRFFISMIKISKKYQWINEIYFKTKLDTSMKKITFKFILLTVLWTNSTYFFISCLSYLLIQLNWCSLMIIYLAWMLFMLDTIKQFNSLHYM